MRVQKYLWQVIATTLIMMLLTGCGPPPTAEPTRTHDPAEEYDVYSVVIEDIMGDIRGLPVIAIDDRTTAVHEGSLAACLEFDEELCEDLLSKGEVLHLEDRFKLTRGSVLLLDYSTFADMSDEAWAEFRDEHGIRMTVHLSRVGFNAQLDRALVYVVAYCGPSCKEIYFSYLTKANGTWTQQDEITVLFA